MQLRTEIDINAPREKVWTVLTDFARYHEWNPFITHIAGELRAGSRLELTISPPESGEMAFRPDVVVCNPGEELRWRGKLLFMGLCDGEHFFRLSDGAAGGTKFVHGEDFTGLFVRFLNNKFTQVARGFVYMNTALKKRVESL